jgi:hypothetical protein
MQTGNKIVNENCILHQTYCGDCEPNGYVTDWEMKISDDSLFCHSFILQDVFLRSF